MWGCCVLRVRGRVLGLSSDRYPDDHALFFFSLILSSGSSLSSSVNILAMGSLNKGDFFFFSQLKEETFNSW